MRYKKRFFMTILGIGGCMALLLVGFGLRDSILDIARIQYKEIQLYDATAIFETLFFCGAVFKDCRGVLELKRSTDMGKLL